MTLAQLLEELTTIRRLEAPADQLPVVLVGLEDDVNVVGVHVAAGAVRLVTQIGMTVNRRVHA